MLVIHAKELLKSLKKVKPVCGANVVSPILNYVKITRNEVACTNFHVSIKEKVNFDGSGEFLLPLNELFNICTVSDDLMTLWPEKVECGTDKYKLGDPEDISDFPVIEDEIEGTEVVGIGDDFVWALICASKCVLLNPASPIGNVNVVRRGDEVSIYGTDSNRMYKNVFKVQCSDNNDFDVLVPVDVIKCLVGLTGEFKMTVSSQKISITNDTTTIIGELAEGKFLPCEMLLQPRHEEVLTIGRSDLVNALTKITSVYSVLPMCEFIFEDHDKIVFFIDHADYKQNARVVLIFSHEISIPSICLNSRHLLDLISLLPTECIALQIAIAAYNKPVIIGSAGLEAKLLIGPLHIRPKVLAVPKETMLNDSQ